MLKHIKYILSMMFLINETFHRDTMSVFIKEGKMSLIFRMSSVHSSLFLPIREGGGVLFNF